MSESLFYSGTPDQYVFLAGTFCKHIKLWSVGNDNNNSSSNSDFLLLQMLFMNHRCYPCSLPSDKTDQDMSIELPFRATDMMKERRIVTGGMTARITSRRQLTKIRSSKNCSRSPHAISNDTFTLARMN